MPIDVESFQRAEVDRRAAAMVDGRHYSAFADEVSDLLRAGHRDAAAGLLLRLVDAIERESNFPLAGHTSVPRWYFDQLAAIYSKEGMERERGLLMQRYALLQARAERDGHLALLRMRQAAATPTTAGPARRPNQRIKRTAFALGQTVAKLLRWAWRRR